MKVIPVTLNQGVPRLGSTADIAEVIEAKASMGVMVMAAVKVPLKIYPRI